MASKEGSQEEASATYRSYIQRWGHPRTEKDVWVAAFLAAREEPEDYDPAQDDRPFDELTRTERIARQHASFHRQLAAVDRELRWKGTGRGRIESIRLLVTAREDTERPDAICGVVCAAGPNGEPLACGYRRNHDGTHSWASLPTWTDRWRIVHQPHRDPKKASLAIEGPPCGSQVVYGVAMDRGIPAHERVRDTEREKR